MTNKNELNELELNKVSGGGYKLDNLKTIYLNELDKNDTVNYIGQVLLFITYVYSNGASHCEWVTGTLLNSYEKSSGCGTKRIATISINESYANIYSGNKDLDLDKWTAYSK